MARDNRFKLVLRNDGEGPNELFNLAEDPREFNNLYDDAGFVTVRDSLAAQLKDWRARTS